MCIDKSRLLAEAASGISEWSESGKVADRHEGRTTSYELGGGHSAGTADRHIRNKEAPPNVRCTCFLGDYAQTGQKMLVASLCLFPFSTFAFKVKSMLIHEL